MPFTRPTLAELRDTIRQDFAARLPGAGALTPAATVTTQAIGDAPVVGTSVNYAREDHKHGEPAFAAITAQTTPDLLFHDATCRDAWCAKAGVTPPVEVVP